MSSMVPGVAPLFVAGSALLRSVSPSQCVRQPVMNRVGTTRLCGSVSGVGWEISRDRWNPPVLLSGAQSEALSPECGPTGRRRSRGTRVKNNKQNNNNNNNTFVSYDVSKKVGTQNEGETDVYLLLP
ncbi:uncharacterized protein V6R79_014530 [Siganus canaliculatus]